jgi:Flp pilus assembly protein TadD
MDQLALTPRQAQELDRIGLEFMAGMLEIEVVRRPHNLPAWSDLGHVLTRLGRNERALEVDREVVRRMPDDETAHYNLACSLALVGDLDAAFAELERAHELGYADADHAAADEDLAPLRADARFAAFLARLRARSEE